MALDDDPETADGTTVSKRVAAWTAAARDNENFAAGGGAVMVLLTVTVVIMHTADYAANVHSPVAFGGALVGVLASVAVATAVASLYRDWPRGRWLSAVGVTALVVLAFTLLPPITAGRGWLAVLLFALVTVAYVALAVAWLLIARPWTWMSGAPD